MKFPYPILGIDEAGRGACIGPMVISGVLIASEEDEELLKTLHVQDSKKLSFKDRKKKTGGFLSLLGENPGIQSFTFTIDARAIDEGRAIGINLDVMERQLIYSIILQANQYIYPPTGIIIDGQLLTKDFTALIKTNFPQTVLHQEPRADSKYITVSMASILAKVQRDYETELVMENEYFKKGKGYPNQWTKEWITYIKDNKLQALEQHIRKSWNWYKKEFNQ